MSLRKIAMPKKTKMLQDLFHDTLKDVYFAEKKDPHDTPKNEKGGSVRGASCCVRKAPR
jgi:hypothetical protein